MTLLPKIPGNWNKSLKTETEKPYFQTIEQSLQDDRDNNISIFPPLHQVYTALELTDIDDLQVVILWQDPYHGAGQAHGLSFSVPEGVKIAPSLRNIYKELCRSYDYRIPDSWNLKAWAEQWVLMLNAILTVQAWNPASHAKIGWEAFTDTIIQTISREKTGVIFLLWWAFAHGKEKLIDTDKHSIIKTTHPSPFSAYRWFLGSDCFIECNKVLKKMWKTEIDWEIKNTQSSFDI